jgi:hypothetical protein
MNDSIRKAFDEARKVSALVGTYRGVRFEVKMDPDQTKEFPQRVYYVYLREGMVPNFEEIWLPDELKRCAPTSPERVSHDYYECARLCGVEMHGGITYYAKHGHSVGHRCVEIGCDYNHLHDDEQHWSAQDLFFDACATIDDCFERGLLKEPTP